MRLVLLFRWKCYW